VYKVNRICLQIIKKTLLIYFDTEEDTENVFPAFFYKYNFACEEKLIKPHRKNTYE
jgi:hypothetical protein